MESRTKIDDLQESELSEEQMQTIAGGQKEVEHVVRPTVTIDTINSCGTVTGDEITDR